MIRVGTILYGYCGGEFGRDSYTDKRVEAIGADWVVVRYAEGDVGLYQGRPEDLEAYTTSEVDNGSNHSHRRRATGGPG